MASYRSSSALAVLSMAAFATVSEARLVGRELLTTTTTEDDDIEPSQLFMIVCLAIGAFVMLVALVACLIVLKRYSGAATDEAAPGPAYANGVGVASVGGNPYQQPMMPMMQPMMPMMQPMQPMMQPMQPMMPLMQPMQTKGAVPMPMPMAAGAQPVPAAGAQDTSVQPISAQSRMAMSAQDQAEVDGVHGAADNNARVQQIVNQAAAGGDHGFQAHAE